MYLIPKQQYLNKSFGENYFVSTFYQTIDFALHIILIFKHEILQKRWVMKWRNQLHTEKET